MWRKRKEWETRIWSSTIDGEWWIETDHPRVVARLEKLARDEGIAVVKLYGRIRCRLPQKWIRITISQKYSSVGRKVAGE